MDKLSELDTDGIEPLIHMSQEVNVLRDDVAEKSMDTKQALMNVPVKDSDYIRVPKFVE
jgi:aspartyl-tRNA(Asn)/glutamyl-tRNA(Gln) amidotransferase subunit C